MGTYDNDTSVDAPEAAKQKYGTTQRMDLDYGGFEFEYIRNSNNAFHYSFYTLLGWGKVSYYDWDANWDDHTVTDYCAVIEPAVNAEVNITNWMRINGGVSYRYAPGVNLEGIDSMDVSGPAANIAFKFGKF
jgi:hypothetical protein